MEFHLNGRIVEKNNWEARTFWCRGVQLVPTKHKRLVLGVRRLRLKWKLEVHSYTEQGSPHPSNVASFVPYAEVKADLTGTNYRATALVRITDLKITKGK